MRGNAPGTVMKFRVGWSLDDAIWDGDYFLFPNTGTCYQVLDVKPRKPGAKSIGTTVVKLEQHEVEIGQPLNADLSGKVWPLEYKPRKRR